MGLTLLGIAGLLLAWEIHLWAVRKDLEPEEPSDWVKRLMEDECRRPR